MPLNTLHCTGQLDGLFGRVLGWRGAGGARVHMAPRSSCLRTSFAISVLVCQGDTLSAFIRSSIVPSSLVLSLDIILCYGSIVMVTVSPCCYFF